MDDSLDDAVWTSAREAFVRELDAKRNDAGRVLDSMDRNRPILDLLRGLPLDDPTDPREVGGNMVGGSGPHSRGDVLFDATRGVLMDFCEVAVMHNPSDGRDLVGMVLHGRINKTTERARILFVFDEDGAAAIISELTALFSRAGGTMADTFEDELEERIAKLKSDGAV